jgi:uncharacterized membrane protein YkoI
MNTQNLVAHKKMLAIMIGVAILATAGMSAASAQTTGTTNTKPTINGSINIEQSLMSQVTVTLQTAADNAVATVPNGKVIGGSLKQMQGSLVYAFQVIDDKNMVYSVIVDPTGDGKVLYTSPGHAFHMGGFGGHGGMKGGFKHGGQGWNKQPAPSTSATPSSGLQ